MQSPEIFNRRKYRSSESGRCLIFSSLFGYRKAEDRGGAKLRVSAENRVREIVVVDIVGEELGLQAESASGSVMDSVFALGYIREVGSIKLNTGHGA